MGFTEKFLKDFIKRTDVNLAFIRAAHANDKKVFEVTQLINSMLGLLVFPKARLDDLIDKKKPLNTYRQDGWEIPEPTIWRKPKKWKCSYDWKNLQEFIRHMRNGVSHSSIEFSSNDDKEVCGLTIWDKKNWKVEFTIEQLTKFTEKMTCYFLTLASESSVNTPT